MTRLPKKYHLVLPAFATQYLTLFFCFQLSRFPLHLHKRKTRRATRDRISHWIHLKMYICVYFCIEYISYADVSFIFLKIQHLLFWTCLCWFHTRESRLTEYCLYIFNQLPYLFKYINRYISWTDYVWPWYITVYFMVKKPILRSMWFRNRKYNGYYYRIEL